MFGGRGGQGRIKLSKLQDSYAAALAPLGIERGVKGSKATHTKVKEYYQAVNSEPLTASGRIKNLNPNLLNQLQITLPGFRMITNCMPSTTNSLTALSCKSD